MPTAAVLGGYGFIGAACLRALREDGHDVVGVGRRVAAGERVAADVVWVAADIARTPVERWREILTDVEIVVNAAGALQTGARDDLAGIHEHAVARLVEALRGRPVRFVQISAAGASETASTEFLRSKARGDAILARSGLDWTVLRPALVLGSQAYGGTALLRAAAALPLAGPDVFVGSRLQTVGVDEVAQAVVRCARGRIAPRRVYDLAEARARSFPETLATMRRWLGHPPWRRTVPVPRPVLAAVGRVADALGWLGWRSPLRTTALRTLDDGVSGDPTAWEAAGGQPFRALEETLARMPSTTQERWFARVYLLLPVAIAVLSAFWAGTGLVALWQREAAEALLVARGFGAAAASLVVVGGAALDLSLGLAVLYRPWARAACLAMLGAAFGYLAGATLLAADLWADPLGPLLKILPAMVLSVLPLALLEER